jgi:hypothetical protein
MGMTSKLVGAQAQRKVLSLSSDVLPRPLLATEHKMAVNSMKHIVTDDLCQPSRLVEKSHWILLLRIKNIAQGPKTAKIEKEGSGKIPKFIYEKLCKPLLQQLPDRLASGWGELNCAGYPFSKGAGKNNGPLQCKQVTVDPYQLLVHQCVLHWLSATYPNGKLIFKQDGVPRTLSFPCRSPSRST